MKMVIMVKAEMKRRVAHHVLYHIGNMIILSLVGCSFHFPSLLAALTKKV